MVFDVESVGLHGEGFAVGYVVLRGDKVVDEGQALCDPNLAQGLPPGREWVTVNCPWAAGGKGLSAEDRERHDFPPARILGSVRELRDWFWRRWLEEKGKGASLWADVGWPVEARFLIACVEDQSPARDWEGPFPLMDVTSYLGTLVTAGMDEKSVEECEVSLGFTGEELLHHPLSDARVSATKIVIVDKLVRFKADV